MTNNQTTSFEVEELVTYVTKHSFSEGFKSREFFNDIFGESEVKAIYPKNIFEEAFESLIFYVIHGKYISEVTKVKEKFTFVTTKLDLDKIVYERRATLGYESTLFLSLRNGAQFNFNALEDSSERWQDKYAQLIHGIYDELLK